MGVIVDAASAAMVKIKITKLKSCKRDLSDDNGSVNLYNKAVDRISSDAQSFLGKQGSAAIVNKLSDYPEPSQSCDTLLENARNYIQREINYLNPDNNCGG